MSWPPQIGELLPRAEAAYGVREKLTDYSLNPEHSHGGPKAVLFRRTLGITLVDVDYLAGSLIAGLAETPVSHVRERPHGLLCEVRIPVRGLRELSDRLVVVTTSWQVRYEDDAPRLVTAYIKA